MRIAWLCGVGILVAVTAFGEPAQRRLHGFAGGWNGPGWWSFQITTTGDLDVSASEHVYRKLHEADRMELDRLLSALPSGNRAYGCDAPLPVDIAAEFLLEVSRPLDSSRPDQVQKLNWCPDGLKGEPTSELRALIAVWQFVRSRFNDSKALSPDEFVRKSLDVGH